MFGCNKSCQALDSSLFREEKKNSREEKRTEKMNFLHGARRRLDLFPFSFFICFLIFNFFQLKTLSTFCFSLSNFHPFYFFFLCYSHQQSTGNPPAVRLLKYRRRLPGFPPLKPRIYTALVFYVWRRWVCAEWFHWYLRCWSCIYRNSSLSITFLKGFLFLFVN